MLCLLLAPLLLCNLQHVDSVQLKLFEKSCAIASQCGLTGSKYAAGLNFTFTTKCCDVDLCNAVGAAPGVPPGTILGILLLLLALC